MNSTIKLMCNNFYLKGYRISQVDTDAGKMVALYTYRNNELFIIMLADADSGANPQIMVTASDSVRNQLLNEHVTDARVLQLIVSGSGDVRDVVSPFFPYWVIDSRENRLIIYENQPAGFGDAGHIIEDSLEGVRYSGNDPAREAMKANRTYPVITSIIVLINVLVYIILELNGSTLDTEFMLAKGALRYEEVVNGGQYYRLVTHFFMHFGIEHILNNMFVLMVIGYHLENIAGRWKFFAVYMASGLLAGIISMNWYHYIGQDSVSAGASGAIFGITGALFVLFFMNRNKLHNISITRIALFLALTIYSGIRDAQIDLTAHIAGFVTGVVVMLLIRGVGSFDLHSR